MIFFVLSQELTQESKALPSLQEENILLKNQIASMKHFTGNAVSWGILFTPQTKWAVVELKNFSWMVQNTFTASNIFLSYTSCNTTQHLMIGAGMSTSFYPLKKPLPGVSVGLGGIIETAQFSVKPFIQIGTIAKLPIIHKEKKQTIVSKITEVGISLEARLFVCLLDPYFPFNAYVGFSLYWAGGFL